ncbi:MAG: NAD(P)-dependent oxidoreductase [Chloroflexota bacterium]
MRTLVLAPFSAEGLDSLDALGGVTCEPWTQTQRLFDPEELGARLQDEGFDAVVVEADFLFDELFTSAPRLRAAAICRAALNQVDLEAATEAGVVVLHTPGRNAQAVAELVLSHAFALARRAHPAAAYVREGRWDDPTDAYTRFAGRELAGGTLGVIGLGDIGRRVARLGRAVGMRVLAHDPYVRPGARGTAGVSLVSLDVLLTDSDVVSIHVPDNEATAGLLDARRIGLMPPGALVVNVTAPGVVDTVALAAALRSGALGGAALDVHEAHPIPPDAPLLALAREGLNVVLTPHIGGATAETVARHSRMVAEDLTRLEAGLRPRLMANRAVWARRRR